LSESILQTPIEFLKGVGPLRADLLKKELNIFSYQDLLEHFPMRHIDKTTIHPIAQINPQTEFIQVAGVLTQVQILGEGRGRRLVAELRDRTGFVQLVWFQGISWVEKSIREGGSYTVFGKPGFFNGIPQFSHPEMEPFVATPAGKSVLEPVYPSTEKLKAKGLGGRQIGKLTWVLLSQLPATSLPENLPDAILQAHAWMTRADSYQAIHFPASLAQYQVALQRLKFEEFFLAQIRLGLVKLERHRHSRGVVFEKVGDLFHRFYENHLPFTLTQAQKRVLKEIRQDTAQGKQMNRLLQGDVGSGKTMVAILSMLLAADNGYQSCLMAPTEILATQHYNGIQSLMAPLGVEVALLTGSTKTKQRREILQKLADGSLHFLIGTHALIEDAVVFHQLGLAIVDEQHRFGVAQRAKLWKKAIIPPHMLVMTATPIPRTLAMTAYGDLDYSVIDELPPGRKPVTTVHRLDDARMSVMQFLREQIEQGRQAYIIFPLIEESEKLDYENLMRGVENVKSYFPEPKYYISMVHGKQAPDLKEANMQRFVQHDTQIMVSTTVIEVGVNVPNASVMVIESAEKFGLSQLHQLRGRVGRGSYQRFCILLTGPKPTNEARERIKTMCATNDGFAIAEKDLELRGPGDIEGTRQSGTLNFKLVNLLNDQPLLELSKRWAEEILAADPQLDSAGNLQLKIFLQNQKGKSPWSKIS
jgi:ATP-dependent DNA helicase RecG